MTLKSQKPIKHSSQEGQKKPMSKDNPAEIEKPFNLLEYFKGVKQEWSKITWPTREQVLAETGVVLVVVAVFSVFIFVVDKIFQWMIQRIT
jgi:preprotein translocase subunit SecE